MYGAIRQDLRIANETRYLSSVREAVRRVVEDSGFPAELLNRLILAVDESVTNVMEHAYEDDIEGELFIEVTVEATGDTFIATIRDWGKSFDPRDLPAPNLEAHVREGRRHGLGVYIMRRIMDEVSYVTDDQGCNELRMTKRTGSAEKKPQAKEARKA